MSDELDLFPGEDVTTWKMIDKSDWPEGEWLTESDKYFWIDKESGFQCTILRMDKGYLCGYIGVDKNHPFYERTYFDIQPPYEYGSGSSLSYIDYSEYYGEDIGPSNMESDDTLWWFGFSCSHHGDMRPAECKEMYKGYYRNVSHVKRIIKETIAELANIDECNRIIDMRLKTIVNEEPGQCRYCGYHNITDDWVYVCGCGAESCPDCAGRCGCEQEE